MIFSSQKFSKFFVRSINRSVAPAPDNLIVLIRRSDLDENLHIWAIPVLKVSYRKWDIAQASDVPQNHQAVEEGLPCNYVQASPLAEEANE